MLLTWKDISFTSLCHQLIISMRDLKPNELYKSHEIWLQDWIDGWLLNHFSYILQWLDQLKCIWIKLCVWYTRINVSLNNMNGNTIEATIQFCT